MDKDLGKAFGYDNGQPGLPLSEIREKLGKLFVAVDGKSGESGEKDGE